MLGWDAGRLAMILAVLEARCGVGFGGLDVYLNVAGGLRITEPAADLAVAAALLSARQDVALPADAVIFGEVEPVGRAAADRAGRRAAARGGEARVRGGLRAGGDADAGRGAAGDSAGCGSGRLHREVLRQHRRIGRRRMDGFNIVDGIALALIVVSAVLA